MGRRISGKRSVVVLAMAAAAILFMVAGAVAVAQNTNHPKVVSLPDGFQPEGIDTQGANRFFVGSIPTGDIFKGDLRIADSGDDPFIDAPDGRSAIGLSLRKGVLFVAGGATGEAYAYNARTGRDLGAFELTTDESFVNDVVTTRTAAYFTDSFNQRLYKIPIRGSRGFGDPEVLPLTGDIEFTEGFNANGIDATRNGKTLVIVQSNTGKLFTVDADTGESTEIDLGGETVSNGDGILLQGRRLWVVQNSDELLTLVRLSPDRSSGVVIDRFTDETFDVPTTVARAGNRLAIVNARFGVEDPEDAEYWVTQIRRPR
jgi:outer membrane protein assembly factor BamB